MFSCLLGSTCKVILYSHNNNNRKYNYDAKIQNRMTLFHLVPASNDVSRFVKLDNSFTAFENEMKILSI